MPNFKCKIANTDGQIIEKIISADNKTSLKTKFDESGDFVFEIRKVKSGGLNLPFTGGGGKVKTKDFYSFNQEFAVLIKAGLSIVGALESILESREKNQLNEILSDIKLDISSGESLSDAFGKYDFYFSELYIASLKAGEKSGDIPLAISRYIEYMKKITEIRQKMISASVYPLILTIASFFVVLFLLMFVVPSLTSTFLESGTELPGLTRMIISISDIIKTRIVHIFGIVIFAIVFIFSASRTESGTEVLDKMKMKIPLIGEVYVNYTASKFARTLSTVLRGGMTLLEGVNVSSGTVTNVIQKRSLQNVMQRIKEGEGFAHSLGDEKMLPMLAVRMISAGESGGALEEVLDNVADFYESDVDAKVSLLTSAIEPLLMVVMGAMIGFIVLAMYLPIFQLAGTAG